MTVFKKGPVEEKKHPIVLAVNVSGKFATVFLFPSLGLQVAAFKFYFISFEPISLWAGEIIIGVLGGHACIRREPCICIPLHFTFH